MTALALGTVQFGLPYGVAGRGHPVSESEIREILRFAHSAGVFRLDTAPAYGDIEQRLDRLAGNLNFEIISKIPSQSHNSSADDTERTITRSIERLGERLTGVLFHSPDDLVSYWDAAHECAKRKSLRLGASYYDPSMVPSDAERYIDFAMAQVPGNALDQRIAKIAHIDVEITLRSAFLQGLLLLPLEEAINRVPTAERALLGWHKWCSDFGGKPLDLALSVAKGLGSDYVVVGVDSMKQLEEILAAWANALPIDVPQLAVSQANIIDPRSWAPFK